MPRKCKLSQRTRGPGERLHLPFPSRLSITVVILWRPHPTTETIL